MDIGLFSTNGQFDIAIVDGELVADNGLRSHVIASLFTDCRAINDDIIPDGSNDKRGFWGDDYKDDKEDSFGSRLWLLERAKETQETLDRAKLYATEALQWFVIDRIATSLQVQTYWLRSGVMAIVITIKNSDSSVFDDLFEYELKVA